MSLELYENLQNKRNLVIRKSMGGLNNKRSHTVKKAVELLDVPSKITFLKSNKYNSKV